jgi:hypothetical protein
MLAFGSIFTKNSTADFNQSLTTKNGRLFQAAENARFNRPWNPWISGKISIPTYLPLRPRKLFSCPSGGEETARHHHAHLWM